MTNTSLTKKTAIAFGGLVAAAAVTMVGLTASATVAQAQTLQPTAVYGQSYGSTISAWVQGVPDWARPCGSITLYRKTQSGYKSVAGWGWYPGLAAATFAGTSSPNHYYTYRLQYSGCTRVGAPNYASAQQDYKFPVFVG